MAAACFSCRCARKTTSCPIWPRFPPDVLAKAKLLVLNYPNSPTGKVATREFYEQVIEFAKRHKIVVVQDAAHIMLTFEGHPLSFLSVPGAKDVGVEVHSLVQGLRHDRLAHWLGLRQREDRPGLFRCERQL